MDSFASGADGLFDLADRRLAWLEKRQSLLAQNIANADTPGYASRDLTPFDTRLAGALGTLGQARTDPLHLANAEDDASLSLEDPPERAVNGNAVSLDTELTKVADTDGAQALVTDLYHKYISLYRTALGR